MTFDNVKGSDLISSTNAIQFSEISNRILNNSPEFAIEYLSKFDGINIDIAKKFVVMLDRVLNTQIVLKEISPEIVKDPEEYIRYFGRLGQGGTRLSDDELTYSIIKQRYPNIHGQMQEIMTSEVGRIASEVDLVLSAIRISKTMKPWKNAKEWEIIARPNPKSVAQLHDHDEVINKFFELIPLDSEEGLLKKALQKIRNALSYEKNNNSNGLPAMLLARLPHELVDVLILFVIKKGVDRTWEKNDQSKLCSFTLYWLLFVKNHDKAAWLAFRHARNEEWHFEQDSIYKLIRAFENDGAANFIPREDDLKKLQDEVNSEVMKEGYILHSWSDRFKAADINRDQKPGEALRVLSTNKELIQRALMWLQRSYLTVNYSYYDPTTDRDDDLPIDLDHIIPHDLFGFYWGDSVKRLQSDIINHEVMKDNFRWQRGLVGDSLGNFRWLDASQNRARGKGVFIPLEDNADFVVEPDDWNKIIPKESETQNWSKEDIATFQRLIDKRTLDIYKEILDRGIKDILPPKN